MTTKLTINRKANNIKFENRKVCDIRFFEHVFLTIFLTLNKRISHKTA